MEIVQFYREIVNKQNIPAVSGKIVFINYLDRNMSADSLQLARK